jgi:MscS family membrane protein
VVYFINKDGHWAHSPSEVNLEILKRFNAAGLDFAFPTQTLLTPDVASS